LRLPPLVVGSLIGASLSSLTVAAAFALIRYDVAGSTPEGLPFDAAMVVIAMMTGGILVAGNAHHVVTSDRPLRWMVALAFMAGPVGALVLTALTAAHDGDLGRALSTLPITVAYSFIYAVPLAAPVSVAGVLLLRALAPMRAWITAMVLTVLAIPALISASGPATTLAGSYGVGPAAPTPVPTLGYTPSVARERPIAQAEVIAEELSRDGASLLSAAPYTLGTVVAAECEAGMPAVVDDACGSAAPVWAVFFVIVQPDGRDDVVMVVIDGMSAEPLLWGSPLTEPAADG